MQQQRQLADCKSPKHTCFESDKSIDNFHTKKLLTIAGISKIMKISVRKLREEEEQIEIQGETD
jgi:hypothetical protein